MARDRETKQCDAPLSRRILTRRRASPAPTQPNTRGKEVWKAAVETVAPEASLAGPGGVAGVEQPPRAAAAGGGGGTASGSRPLPKMRASASLATDAADWRNRAERNSARWPSTAQASTRPLAAAIASAVAAAAGPGAGCAGAGGDEWQAQGAAAGAGDGGPGGGAG